MMKLRVIALLIIVLVTTTGCHQNINVLEKGCDKVEIAYDNPNIRYFGRWRDTGTAKRVNWHGSYIKFKFTGTSLGVNMAVSASDTPNLVYYAIDGIGNETYKNATNGILQLAAGLDDNEHTAIIRFKLKSVYEAFSETDYMDFISIVIDEGEQVSTWIPDASKKILCLGDSYTAGSSPYHLHLPSKYETYPVAFNGSESGRINDWYPYIYAPNYPDFTGAVPHNDPTDFAGVIIMLGTNDAAHGVSISDFKTRMTQLITKVKADLPGIPIWCIQGLKNEVNDFSIYGDALQEIAYNNAYVRYISTDEIWDDITYSDNVHPDASGSAVLANHIASYLEQQSACEWESIIQICNHEREEPVKLLVKRDGEWIEPIAKLVKY